MQQVRYNDPLFKTSQVAAAAGIPAATLRSYFKRGQFEVIGRHAEGDGLPHKFSLRDALVFAVAVRLIENFGADPRNAFEIAVQDFAHVGTAERLPGTLFDVQKHGLTWLIYWPPSGSAALRASKGLQEGDLMFSPSHGRQDSFGVVVLNYVERQVFAALGI